jgi:hypothetical protein
VAAVLAALHMTAERGGTARLDGRHDLLFRVIRCLPPGVAKAAQAAIKPRATMPKVFVVHGRP